MDKKTKLDYVEECVPNEKIMIDILKKNLDLDLKFIDRKNYEDPFDVFVGWWKNEEQYLGNIKIELESTAEMLYWKDQFPPRRGYQSWPYGFNVPNRKIKEEKTWDIYIKFSHTFECFWAGEYNYIITYGQRKDISNKCDHIPGNKTLFVVDYKYIDYCSYYDQSFHGNAIVQNNFSNLEKLIKEKILEKSPIR